MRFYNKQHKYYCGIDLHARKMYVCIVNQQGKVRVHKNIKTDPELFFELVFPFLDDIVVGVECVFCWYWLADGQRRSAPTAVERSSMTVTAIKDRENCPASPNA